MTRWGVYLYVNQRFSEDAKTRNLRRSASVLAIELTVEADRYDPFASWRFAALAESLEARTVCVAAHIDAERVVACHRQP